MTVLIVVSATDRGTRLCNPGMLVFLHTEQKRAVASKPFLISVVFGMQTVLDGCEKVKKEKKKKE